MSSKSPTKVSSSNQEATTSNGQLQPHTNGVANPALDQAYLTKVSRVVCDDMIYYCFDVLHTHLHKGAAVEHAPRPQFVDNEFPLFVTWYIGRDKRLRGCIGTFQPLPLHDGLKEYAITSALRDTRFNPINKVTCSSFESRYLCN